MKKYTFVFPLIFILVIAYWRYTYIINPNFLGEQMMVNIRDLKFSQNTLSTFVTVRSIIIYWTLFLLGNTALYLTIFGWSEKLKSIIGLYLLISFVSALFFAFDAFWIKSTFSFDLAAILKNFILSPVFTAVIYLIVSYFQWFEKPS